MKQHRLSKAEEEPFLEHPDGTYASALEAIAGCIRRLDELPESDRWILLCAQGRGGRDDSYEFVELPVRGRAIQLGNRKIDLSKALTDCGLRMELSQVTDETGTVHFSQATPQQFALLIDALFREFGIRTFKDQDDYAVGAEWR